MAAEEAKGGGERAALTAPCNLEKPLMGMVARIKS